MGLGREVDDRLAAGGSLLDRAMIRDVALVELVRDPGEIRGIARIGELVEHADLVAGAGKTPDEVRADEAGSAGDEHAHRGKP
jgi:hypothetical protein